MSRRSPGPEFDDSFFRMTSPRIRFALAGLLLAALSVHASAASAQATVGTLLDDSLPPGDNDKSHDQGFIEEYADVSRGSGRALLDALAHFAARSGLLGSYETHVITPVGEGRAPTVPTAWLPSARAARLWVDIETGQH